MLGSQLFVDWGEKQNAFLLLINCAICSARYTDAVCMCVLCVCLCRSADMCLCLFMGVGVHAHMCVLAFGVYMQGVCVFVCLCSHPNSWPKQMGRGII
jgi:hypothetical protein